MNLPARPKYEEPSKAHRYAYHRRLIERSIADAEFACFMGTFKHRGYLSETRDIAMLRVCGRSRSRGHVSRNFEMPQRKSPEHHSLICELNHFTAIWYATQGCSCVIHVSSQLGNQIHPDPNTKLERTAQRPDTKPFGARRCLAQGPRLSRTPGASRLSRRRPQGPGCRCTADRGTARRSRGRNRRRTRWGCRSPRRGRRRRS